MVWCVGEVLGLEADGRTERECAAVGALIARSIVGGVKLHTWFGGEYFHRTSAGRIGYLGGKTQFALFALVQHVVVVEALAELDLLVVGIDVLSEGFRLTEVERRAFNLQDLTCWNGGGVGRQIEVCIDLTDLIQDCWGRISGACQ